MEHYDVIGTVETLDRDSNAAAVFASVEKITADTFKEPKEPKEVGGKKVSPWGSDNKLPSLMLERFRESEIVNSNIDLNIQTAYGRGMTIHTADNMPMQAGPEKDFFKRNRPRAFLQQQFTNMKHWSWGIGVIVMTNDRKKVARIDYHDTYDVRFGACNKEGIIEYVYISDWDDDQSKPVEISLLDIDDPYGDCMIRLGRIPNDTDRNIKTDQTQFAFLFRQPCPGKKYYPIPYWWAIFNSGWYDIARTITRAKLSKVKNSFKIKYVVEIHRDYFDAKFKTEKITDPVKQQALITETKGNIMSFLEDQESKDKTFFSIFYIDPITKQEVKMIKITCVDGQKEGGEYIPDIQEASAIVSQAMGVHTNMSGAISSANKGSLGGSDKRELFNIKSTYEIALRQMMCEFYELVADINGWDLQFMITDTVMTTLDQGGDAKEQNNEDPIKEIKKQDKKTINNVIAWLQQLVK